MLGPAVDLDRWRTSMAGAVVPLEIDAAADFRGRFDRTVVDGVSVLEIAAEPHLVRRTPELIAPGDPHCCKLSLQLSGTARLEQNGRTAELRPGDLAVYDTDRPYELSFPGRNRAVVMVIPRGMLDLAPEEVDGVTAVRFPRDSGLGKVVNPFLAELGTNRDQLAGAGAARLVHSALDLLVTMLSAELHRGPASADPVRGPAREVRDYILEHLGDPGLDPSSIARANHVSLRRLYALFGEGEPVAAWIRSRRLERIRRDLADPRYADRPVSWIAARWGLTDPAHFSRTFKAAYGRPPSAYRAASRRGARGDF
ncbi:helix-turn-helix domain-containing protein [Saccharopolyspora griseoalba]|uniref:Helix-turn-helix domain-containing protein n=1 Tax=Saccharopolyspora griseoalba TaxID=1431848 RepID=A0ABW2LP90_9PSEU